MERLMPSFIIKLLLIISLILPNLTYAGSLQEEAYKKAWLDAKLPVYEYTNSNDHPRIKEYCKNVGIPYGSPYCAAAVFTWYKEGSAALGIANPLYKTGSTKQIYLSALKNPMRFKFKKARLIKLGTERIELGDIILYSSDSNFTHGHTEFAVEQLSKISHHDIGANTTGSNILEEQREQTKKSKGKGGVYHKIRNISDNPKMKTIGAVSIN